MASLILKGFEKYSFTCKVLISNIIIDEIEIDRHGVLLKKIVSSVPSTTSVIISYYTKYK